MYARDPLADLLILLSEYVLDVGDLGSTERKEMRVQLLVKLLAVAGAYQRRGRKEGSNE